MEELLTYQNELLENLKNAEKNYRKSPKDRIKKPYLETRLELLEQLWKEFKDGHRTIVSKMSKDDSYFEENTYETFEELYIQYKSSLKEAIQPFLDASKYQHSYVQASTPTDETQKTLYYNKVKLPTIQIPKFNGKYEEWQTFYDLFYSLIHKNESLSPVQKLHYLKSNISGEPEVLIRNLSTTDANYEEAWDQLVKRYNNKRYNCNATLRSLFTQKPIQSESSYSIKQLLDTTSTSLKSLKNMGVETDYWDMIINYLVVSKLDSESIKKWEQQLSTSNNDLPTWPELRDFLEARFRSLEMIDSHKPRMVQTKSIAKPKAFHSNIQKETKRNDMKCALCNDNHYVYHCKSFSDMSTRQRQEFVKENGLCFNCLAPTHSVIKCRQSACCKRCGRRHHSLLHFERELDDTVKPSERESAPTGTINEPTKGKPEPLLKDTNIVTNFSKECIQTNCVLLATAQVMVNSRNGCNYIVRALLDQGSQASFVTEGTVQLLNLTRTAVSGWVSGVGEGQTRIKHMVSLQVKSRHNPQVFVQVNAYVLRSLTTLLPNTNLSTPMWSDIAKLELADPQFTTPGKIDILLGAEVYGNILLNGVIKHPEGNLLAQNTSLGWVISGKISQTSTSTRRNITSLHVQQKEDEILKLFWELENEPNSIHRRLTKEEEWCERFYDATTIRDDEGRYIVRLPFNKENPECEEGRLRDIALKRFKCLENKFLKNPTFCTEYHKVIDEYIQLNHMVKVDQTDIDNPRAVYLPHHAVLREDKDTTKLRIVFDASCKGVNNVSLNDNLVVGPKLQQDLRHILMRWRTHKICITADIIKMYRMVRVADENTNYQRILWRSTQDQPVQHYKLLRLTFGTACAPYLAVKSLQRLADDETSSFPTAAKIAKTDFYIDDLLTGCETEQDAMMIYNEMNKLMNLGGFELQKWSSNNDTLLKHIGDNKRIDHELPLKLNDLVKVLGVIWNRVTDNFQYTIALSESKQLVTKRHILSEVAKLYDPLGWIAPVVVVAKIMIQKLWRSGREWDDAIEGELLSEWLHYRENLNELKHVCVPRWLNCLSTATKELHVFTDASQTAYGAVVYMRVVEGDSVFVNLISAKTKVAPIAKQLSIPRLELCGAALGAKLISEISQVMHIPKTDLYAWSDSTIVLAWLKGGSNRWSTFVSNRVSEILTILDYEQWGHVATELNPADCTSRGLLASELLTHNLWWCGPPWLHMPQLRVSKPDIDETQEEERVSSLTVSSRSEDEFIWIKYSNLHRMLRIMSYCRRLLIVKINKDKRPAYTKQITIKEIKDTLEMCVKQVQGIEFKEELHSLKTQGHVPKKSTLRSLCPVLDENGILRVGGRIQHANVDYETQHPIILPAKSYLSRLIIIDAHHKTLHGGPQIMLHYLRSKFWILRAKNQINKCYRECVTCIRYSAKSTPQLMGQLPEVRVKPDRPFRSTGVDYAGPINIRFSPGRGAKSYKGYICLFVCMVTRAVHLEAVTDMTAKGFIAAFRRFTSRRGHCYDLYSDNGTTFIGANTQMKYMFDNAKSTLPAEIAELLTLERTTWHYIPPYAPNFGGLWEAGVRSTKTHLKRVIGDSTLTYEELSTVLAQIEACLNSRPMTVLSDDPDDPLPLTPGHFLIGEPILNLADENYKICNVNHLERWRLVQKMVTDFWNRWHKEYLVNLNQRQKWNTKGSEPEINDIVILKEDNIPPCKWILGKIIKKHSGPDQITRVVSIKCKNGVFKRPISKICILVKQN